MRHMSAILASAAIATLITTVVFADDASTTSQPQTIKEEIQPMIIKDFAEKYVRLWSVTDDKEREALATELFAEGAEHYVAPANVSFIGRDAIIANITNVNMGAIQKGGLTFKGGDSIVNHNSILVEWSAAAPNGQTVRSGRDLLILNGEGKARFLYMFTSN